MKTSRIAVAAILFANLTYIPGLARAQVPTLGTAAANVIEKCFSVNVPSLMSNISKWQFDPVKLEKNANAVVVSAIDKSGKLFYRFITPLSDTAFLAKMKIGDLAMAIKSADAPAAVGKLLKNDFAQTVKETKELIVGTGPKSAINIDGGKTTLKQVTGNPGLLGHAKAVSNVMLHKLTEFPSEATYFFIALGALQMKDLMLRSQSEAWATNPLGLAQFLESQKDPIGQIGFLAFMEANGISGHYLQQVLTTPNLQRFIPYLGMSIGSTASNITHEVGHSMKECLANDKDPAEKMNCYEEAWKVFKSFATPEKIATMMPTLLSMTSSTILAGLLEGCALGGAGSVVSFLASSASARMAIKAGGMIGSRAVRNAVFVSLRLASLTLGTIAASANPASGVAFSIYKVIQIATFVVLDQKLNELITPAWTNFWDGRKFDLVDKELLKTISHNIGNDWQTKALPSCFIPSKPPIKLSDESTSEFSEKIHNYEDWAKYDTEICENELNRILEKMHSSMPVWRQFNLQKSLGAHAQWSDKLNKLSGMYQATKDFYQDVTSRLVDKVIYEKEEVEQLKLGRRFTPQEEKARDDQHQLSSNLHRILGMWFPLNGIMPKDLNSEKKNVFLAQPEAVHFMQLETLLTVLKSELFSADYTNKNIFLYPRERDAIVRMQSEFTKGMQAMLIVDSIRSVPKAEFATVPPLAEKLKLLPIFKNAKSIAHINTLRTETALHSKAFIDAIMALRNTAALPIAKAIQLLNQEDPKYPGVSELPSEIFRNFVRGMKTALGNPVPLLNRGSAYLDYYSKYSANSRPDYHEFYISSFTGGYKYLSGQENLVNSDAFLWTPTYSDHLALAMLFGPNPDQNEELTPSTRGLRFWKKGLRSSFLAPQIIPSRKIEIKTASRAGQAPAKEIATQYDQETLMAIHPGNRITSAPLDLYEGNLVKKNYSSVFEYIMASIRDRFISVVKDPVSGLETVRERMTKWWQISVEPAYVNIWSEYEEAYQDIVAGMIQKIQHNIEKPAYVSQLQDGTVVEHISEKDSGWNPGPVANNVMESIKQERNLYLMVAGELLKSLHLKQGKAGPQALPLDMDKTRAGANSVIKIAYLEKSRTQPFGKGSNLSILTLLRHNSSLDFRNLVYPAYFDKPPRYPHNLQIQTDIEKSFAGIEKMIMSIKVKEFSGKMGVLQAPVIDLKPNIAAIQNAQKSLDILSIFAKENVSNPVEKVALQLSLVGFKSVLQQLAAPHLSPDKTASVIDEARKSLFALNDFAEKNSGGENKYKTEIMANFERSRAVLATLVDELPYADLKPSHVSAQILNAQKSLNELKTIFASYKSSLYQKAIFEECMTGLGKLVDELANYVNIANAVSYRYVYDDGTARPVKPTTAATAPRTLLNNMTGHTATSKGSTSRYHNEDTGAYFKSLKSEPVATNSEATEEGLPQAIPKAQCGTQFDNKECVKLIEVPNARRSEGSDQ